uniref:Nuclear receptor domain-containing protein n=1 Tax=Acrobeloides nanus TaxID=290746 RepID=A0A914E945_9BILA
MDEGVCMTICAICGDRATGKHFGAISCHSCKDRRTDCRACRYNRCIKAGMKAEAVQMERDSIGKRQRVSSSSGATSNSKTSQESMEFTPSPESLIGIIDDDWESPKALIDALLRSEEKMKSLKEVVITKTGKLWTAMNVKGGDKANLDDIYHSIHTQLILVIEWAKTIQSFVQLPTDDQVNFCSQIRLAPR